MLALPISGTNSAVPVNEQEVLKSLDQRSVVLSRSSSTSKPTTMVVFPQGTLPSDRIAELLTPRDELISTLTNILAHADLYSASTRARAAWALRDYNNIATKNILSDLLRDPDPEVRLSAAVGLPLSNPDALNELHAVIDRKRHDNVWRFVMKKLIHFHDDKAQEAAGRAISHNGQGQHDWLDILAECSSSLPQGLQQPLRDIVTDSAISAPFRFYAAKALLPDQVGCRYLEGQLASADPLVRIQAAQLLLAVHPGSKNPSTTLQKFLLEKATGANRVVIGQAELYRSRAALALQKHGATNEQALARSVLEGQLQSDAPMVACRAAEFLGSNNLAARKWAEHMVDNGDLRNVETISAACLLGDSYLPARKVCEELLSGPSSGKRVRAAVSLGIDNVGATRSLVRLLLADEISRFAQPALAIQQLLAQREKGEVTASR